MTLLINNPVDRIRIHQMDGGSRARERFPGRRKQRPTGFSPDFSNAEVRDGNANYDHQGRGRRTTAGREPAEGKEEEGREGNGGRAGGR